MAMTRLAFRPFMTRCRRYWQAERRFMLSTSALPGNRQAEPPPCKDLQMTLAAATLASVKVPPESSAMSSMICTQRSW